MRPIYFLCLLVLIPFTAFGIEPVTFPQDTLAIATKGGDRVFTVEVATTEDQMHYGLMNRQKLAPMHGMIFVFGKPMKVTFWMKDTPLPLDMLFIAQDGRISRIEANAVPESTTQIPSKAPVRAVLELQGGSAAKYHIAAGDKVHYSIFP